MLALAPLNVDILPDDCAVLKGLLVKLHAQYGAAIEAMHQQILKLRHAQFGASSERLSTQTDLFAEILDLPLPPVIKQKISYERQRKGRPALPKDLPRQRIEYHLDDQQMAEFDSVKPIGEEVSETLQYTPARLVVLEHARIKYACTKDGQSTVRTAYAQPSPLPKCNADASLLAQILTATFADHVPLNRQSMIFGRHGFPVPRSTLDDWKLGSAELLEVLRAPLIAHTLSAPRLHSDDTTVQLRDASKDTTHTSRLWAYLGAGQRQDDQGQWVEHPPSVVFEFTRTRQGIHPQRFLKDYHGYLQIDAYSGYDALLKSGDIVAVGCMAHTRRHFFEVARKDPNPQGLAAQALAWIAKLYEIESHIKDHPPDKKLLTRQTQSRPVLDQFHTWLVGHAPGIPARSELGQAFGYALRQWETLVRYTEDGILMPDNNLIESAIRPVAVGRRSWLFLGAERGGHVAATMYSLIGTCRLNGVEPYAWLCDVLKRLPNHPVTKLAELLPFNWKRQSITQT
jgi:transposase